MPLPRHVMLINCNIASSDTLWVTCNATQPAYLQLKDILMLQMFALRAILYAVQALALWQMLAACAIQAVSSKSMQPLCLAYMLHLFGPAVLASKSKTHVCHKHCTLCALVKRHMQRRGLACAHTQFVSMNRHRPLF